MKIYFFNKIIKKKYNKELFIGLNFKLLKI